jgi:hypothetical protein
MKEIYIDNHREIDFQRTNERICNYKDFYLSEKKNFHFELFSDRIGLDNNNDQQFNSLSRSDSCRSSNDSISRNHLLPYSILTGPKNPNDIVDCQIIIVNVRQRFVRNSIEKISYSYLIETMQKKLNLVFVLMIFEHRSYFFEKIIH